MIRDKQNFHSKNVEENMQITPSKSKTTAVEDVNKIIWPNDSDPIIIIFHECSDKGNLHIIFPFILFYFTFSKAIRG